MKNDRCGLLRLSNIAHMRRLRLRAIRIVQTDRQRVAATVFLKMSSIEHFRAVARCIISIKTRSLPETNIVRACGGAPEEPHERHAAAPACAGT